MRWKPRLLPALILAALALFGLKLEPIVRGVTAWGVHAAIAKEKADAAAAEAATATQPDAAGAKTAAAGDQGGTKAGAAVRPRQASRKQQFSPAELQVLEHLSERRQELDAWGERLDMRERVLAATEKRIDEKIGSLKQLEARIEKLLKQHDEEAERQLKSLVKVYENMKPKDAARIFEQLEMDILLDVTQRMREAKMAPVLAAMNAEKAKALTVELARRRVLPETGG